MSCAADSRADGVAARLRPFLRSAVKTASTVVPVTVRIVGGAMRLRALGISARPLSSSTAAVDADPARLAQLAEVRAVDGPRRFHTFLDAATQQSRATLARQETGLDGRGVLVASTLSSSASPNWPTSAF